MTMHNAGAPVVQDDRRARPERKFETRRGVLIILFIIPLLCIVFFVVRGCSDPFGGSKQMLSGSAAASGVTATAVPVNLLPSATAVSVDRNNPLGLVTCYMVADVSFVNGLLPVNAKVSVNGYTFAGGGRVFVAEPAAGWIDAGLVKCIGDLRSLERSYFLPATPTALPTATLPRVTPTVQRIIVNAPPAPTYTPYPTYTPFPSLSASGLGVYRESGDCWRFDISNIREIRVNRNDPVAGGSLVCGVKNFTVVVE